ncbi:MAG: signal recognition particle-docking protein FtsY [Syntrophus sp. (in: bacteria)]|nr:signal recognition particle-docking protein FtsY [Syntrophus sp. (in: bacteria)]
MNSDIRKKSFLDKLKSGLEKTRKLLLTNVDDIILGEKVIDPRLFEELEDALIMADVGPAFTYDLIEKIKQKVRRNELDRPELLKKVLQDAMKDILRASDRPFAVLRDRLQTFMIVGVNGTGKTTTIGKMACQFKQQGHDVLIAAADTFRAAAIEQIEVWCRRADVPLIRQQPGADPAAVVYDAIQAARAGKTDILIIDTAGRLHTKVNLMEELKKMKRIMERELPGVPHEILLVIDATTGQNAINQAKMFQEEIGVTGIILTKLDGTAKGGIVIRIARELQIPIRYIGVGEQLEDLRPFDGDDFIEALFE